jgi:choline dehydrogenase-like flavoprotein
MSTVFDAVVVGSGPTGAWAAAALVRGGAKTLLIDAGLPNPPTLDVPAQPFDDLRRNDPDQGRYLLGPAMECVSFDNVRTGGQVTAPRRWVGALAPAATPIRSSTFRAMEGLAWGGLGAAWAAVAVPFDDADLAPMPLRRTDLADDLRAVCTEVGISAGRDALTEELGDPGGLLPALPSEPCTEAMLRRYAAKEERLRRAGLVVGRPWLAALSEDRGARSKHRLLDLDFYGDSDDSVWRPPVLLRGLEGLSTERGLLVQRFSEEDGLVRVEARATVGKRRRVFRARRLILAAGALGTARIALRSLDPDASLPIACNRLRYAPCLDPRRLGRPNNGPRHSLSQALMLYRPPGEPTAVFAQVHAYRSLLLWKLIRESFLAARESRKLLRELNPAMAVLSMYQGHRPAPGQRLRLQDDELHVDFPADPAADARVTRNEDAFLKRVRRLGWWPLRRVDSEAGASIHYAGTLPMMDADRPMTTARDGRLRGTENVYIADGSVLPELPAKPLTLTCMANARRVARGVAGGLS